MRVRPAVPLPGSAVRGSKSGRPLMAAFDLLGRRWTLRILWELRNGPLGFRALRHACDDLSPTLLNGRLGELRGATLVENLDEGYALTDLGKRLLVALRPLSDWADQWNREIHS